jgi:putative transposase
MTYQPFIGVPCAYQLHYHFCFQTKGRRARFSQDGTLQFLASTLESICHHCRYHVLAHSVEDDRLYCLLSLKPDDVVSVVSRTLKSNMARQFNLQFPNDKQERSIWSIGYYVGSVGKASKKSAQGYIENQGEHHGIRVQETRELMRWTNPQPPALRAAHVTFDLSYHVVLVTSTRTSIFDQYIAPNLFKAMAGISEAKGFYIERASLLYDHIHMLIKLTPSLCVRECIQEMMAGTWRFMMDRYKGVLKSTGAYNVWTESFYVSTVGHATTAQIKSFLSEQ